MSGSHQVLFDARQQTRGGVSSDGSLLVGPASTTLRQRTRSNAGSLQPPPSPAVRTPVRVSLVSGSPPLRRSRVRRLPSPDVHHRLLCPLSSAAPRSRLHRVIPRPPVRQFPAFSACSLNAAWFLFSPRLPVESDRPSTPPPPSELSSNTPTPRYTHLHITLTPLPVWVHLHLNACPAVRLLLQSIGCHSPDLPPRGWGREVWRMAPVTPAHCPLGGRRGSHNRIRYLRRRILSSAVSPIVPAILSK